MEKHITYWIDSANHDFDVAQTLFDNGKYDWCLFIAHLVLEKTLKACYVQNKNEFPPRTHDLVKLAQMAEMELKEETLEFLDIVNTFNISTRYPDEKFKFYSLCTKDFATKNFNKIKEIRKCLLKKIF
jgi:HEPN domain-containing protein